MNRDRYNELPRLFLLGLVGCGESAPQVPVYDLVVPTASEVRDSAVTTESQVPRRPRMDGLLTGHQVFVGSYVCSQGDTDMSLTVLEVSGSKVRAIFAFDYAPSQSAGKYVLTGTFDEKSRELQLTPDKAIQMPAGWVMVGLRATFDGRTLDGQMLYGGCGEIHASLLR